MIDLAHPPPPSDPDLQRLHDEAIAKMMRAVHELGPCDWVVVRRGEKTDLRPVPRRK